jgi:hypothetical protein
LLATKTRIDAEHAAMQEKMHELRHRRETVDVEVRSFELASAQACRSWLNELQGETTASKLNKFNIHLGQAMTFTVTAYCIPV